MSRRSRKKAERIYTRRAREGLIRPSPGILHGIRPIARVLIPVVKSEKVGILEKIRRFLGRLV